MFRTSKCSSSGTVVHAALWFFNAEIIIKSYITFQYSFSTQQAQFVLPHRTACFVFFRAATEGLWLFTIVQAYYTANSTGVVCIA